MTNTNIKFQPTVWLKKNQSILFAVELIFICWIDIHHRRCQNTSCSTIVTCALTWHCERQTAKTRQKMGSLLYKDWPYRQEADKKPKFEWRKCQDLFAFTMSKSRHLSARCSSLWSCTKRRPGLRNSFQRIFIVTKTLCVKMMIKLEPVCVV